MTDERSNTGKPPAERKPAASRAIDSDAKPAEKQVDHALRPRSLQEMIGQERLRDKMQILVEASRQRGDALDHVLLYGPPGLGKCITAASLILTDHGLIPFAELLPPDLPANEYRECALTVYGLDGLEPASHVYANGAGPTISVRTHDGFALEGTPNHPLLVATATGPRWKPLQALLPGDFVAVARDIGSPRQDNPAPLPVSAEMPDSARGSDALPGLNALPCNLLNPAIDWAQVASLHPGHAETFDFVVPGTHSFVANGFFCHNTTLSHILAYEMGANLKVTAGPAVEKAGDLAAILTNLRKGDILFIDEIHRLGRAVEEILYPAMEDFSLNIVVGSGPGARNIQLSLPKFTIVGATTRLALMTSPLRARFGVVERFDFYEPAAVQEIVLRAARLLQVPLDAEGAQAIARRARGTPRVALRLLRRLRDYAQVRADGRITVQVADAALALLEIDALGLDDLDRRVLDALINKFSGGPVGLDTLAASISEEADTIMDVVEPYLLQLGFLDRTPRGRVPTRAAYAHLQVPYPERYEQNGMFG